MANKRIELTLSKKKHLIEEFENGTSVKNLVDKYGVTKSCICKILKKKNLILNALSVTGQENVRRVRPPAWSELETTLVSFIKTCRTSNLPVTGPLLKEKAIQIASDLELDSFQASEGWLTKFKLRNNIKFKTFHGDAADMDEEVVNLWKNKELNEVSKDYEPKNIYNCDETGLFYHLLPSKSFVFESDKCKAGKKSKERLTVLVCANSDGSDKPKLLVIGKSKNPRCFKNIQKNHKGEYNLPVTYRNNTKAWMTASFFDEYLASWNEQLRASNRSILVILDNATCHKPQRYSNIKLGFLPPNTTAATQPCDQGIIQNLKVHYRHELLKRRIFVIEAGEVDHKISLLEGLHLLAEAWANVTPKTIYNCFRKAGLHNETTVDIEIIDPFLNTIGVWNKFSKLVGTSSTTFDQYAQCDSEIATNDQSLPDNTIPEDDLDAEDNPESDEIINFIPVAQAMSGILACRRYLEEHGDVSLNKELRAISEKLLLYQETHQKQSIITDYFNPQS